MEDYTFEVVVADNIVGQRLDVFLYGAVESIPSRSFCTKLIKEGYAEIVGMKKTKASHQLRVGEVIKVDLSPLQVKHAAPQPEKADLDILFEDTDILVLNKTPGMVVHPGAGNHSGTLVNAVLHHCGETLPSLGGQERAGIVHRLDKETSGVMVVAKTQQALTELSKQFAQHSQTRQYLALVYGLPHPNQGKVETEHGRHPTQRIKFACVPKGKGKTATMSYGVEESYLKGAASLVKCALETGRTHQIRVQLEALGHPLFGDILYTQGLDWNRFPPQLRKQIQVKAVRQMLHAYHLGFIHPTTGEAISFTVPPPEDFLVLQDFLKSEPQ